MIGVSLGVVLRYGAHLPIGVVVATLAAAIALIYPASLPYWRRLDEMARQAHLVAWFWGGSLGGGFALLCSLALVVRGEIDRSLMRGAALTLAAQVVGSVIVWACWWARRRGRAAQ
jgi:hypothetical protein